MQKKTIHPSKRLGALERLPEPTKITGFASPATGYEAHSLSIDDLVGLGAPHIFLWTLRSDALRGMSYFTGDILVVNRGSKPAPGAIVIVILDEEHRICQLQGKAPDFTFWIEPVAGQRQQLERTESVSLWGVVERVLRDVRVFKQ